MTLAKTFQSLHIKNDPVILFNVWDAGSAMIVANAGAKAIATGSAPVAMANGFADGENIPLKLVLKNIRRIVNAVDLPVSCDIEGGYGAAPKTVAATITRVVQAGAVGFNFEDQIVGTDGLYDIDTQSARIQAARDAADTAGRNIFMNARTDLFLKSSAADHGDHIEQAIKRAHIYAKSGANGFFTPGLADAALIKQLCDECPIPVNILALPTAPSSQIMADIGVARISYGPIPYRKMAAWMAEEAIAAISYKS